MNLREWIRGNEHFEWRRSPSLRQGLPSIACRDAGQSSICASELATYSMRSVKFADLRPIRYLGKQYPSKWSVALSVEASKTLQVASKQTSENSILPILLIDSSFWFCLLILLLDSALWLLSVVILRGSAAWFSEWESRRVRLSHRQQTFAPTVCRHFDAHLVHI